MGFFDQCCLCFSKKPQEPKPPEPKNEEHTPTPPLSLLVTITRPEGTMIHVQPVQPLNIQKLPQYTSSLDTSSLDTLRSISNGSPPLSERSIESNHSPRLGKQKQEMRVLIVEDSHPNTKSLRRLLIDMGFSNNNITPAENGRIAFKQCEESVFDVIFMDIVMPLMHGDIAARDIRQEGLNQKTPIIGQSTDIMTLKALVAEKVFDGYIQKGPYEKNNINHVINKILNAKFDSLQSEEKGYEKKASKELGEIEALRTQRSSLSY